MPCIAITKRATGRQNPETHIDCRHQRIPAHFSRRLLRIDDRGQDHTVESAIPPPQGRFVGVFNHGCPVLECQMIHNPGTCTYQTFGRLAARHHHQVSWLQCPLLRSHEDSARSTAAVWLSPSPPPLSRSFSLHGLQCGSMRTCIALQLLKSSNQPSCTV